MAEQGLEQDVEETMERGVKLKREQGAQWPALEQAAEGLVQELARPL